MAHVFQTASELPHLPRPQGREALRRNTGHVQGLRKCEKGRINRFIGQLERAVMVGERNFCTTIDQWPALPLLGSCGGRP